MAIHTETIIRVLRDPCPEGEKPDFMKEAYIGLQLRSTLIFEPGEEKPYPEGVYMVPLRELLKALAPNKRACEYVVAEFGLTLATAETVMAGDRPAIILIPFPFECCEVVE